MAKKLSISLSITLPNGQPLSLASHEIGLNTLEQYAVEAILAANGGSLDLRADAKVSEVDA